MKIGIWFIILIVVACVGMVGLVTLLSNPRTRRFGCGAVGALAVAVGAALFLFLFIARPVAVTTAEVYRRPEPARATITITPPSETPARPKWADAADGFVGDVYEMTVFAAGADDAECNRLMRAAIGEKTKEYLDKIYADGAYAGRLTAAGERLAPAVPEFIKEKYQETNPRLPDGANRVHYARLQFGPKVIAWLDREVRDATIQDRIKWLAAIVAGAVALVAAAWGAMTAVEPDGNIRWPLVFGVLAALVAVVILVLVTA